jgi:hypothetical protein
LLFAGKSTLWENVILEIAHNLTTEQGVGRFKTESKSVLLLHDCPLSMLVVGKDKDRLKAISRSEPTTAKVHSSTNVINYVHLFATSNQHLLSHQFHEPDTPFCKDHFKVYHQDAITPRQLENVSRPDWEAVKKRFLECYVRKKPPLKNLMKNGTFSRLDCIRGTMNRVLIILCAHGPEHVNSRYYFLYPMSGAAKNICHMPQDLQSVYRDMIIDLMLQYKLDAEEKAQIMSFMENVAID